MKTSRKRLSGRNDGEGNKRKLRRSKTNQVDHEEENADSETDVQNDIFVEANNSAVSLEAIQTCSNPYNNEIDEKIIKYFKANMNLLNMTDDESVFHVLKAKYSIQKSAKSLQLRFVNVILPNLFKYDIMNQAELIDFYDAAKLELPEEFINILNNVKNTNINNSSSQNNISKKSDKKTKEDDAQSSASKNKENISVQNENIASNTSIQLESQSQSSTSKNKQVSQEGNISDQNEDIVVVETCRQSNIQVKEAIVWRSKKIKNLDNITSNKCRTSKNTKAKRKRNISDQNEAIAIPSTSRQSNNQTEKVCTQSISSKEMNLKSILNFILFNYSKDNYCVYIPDTEPDIPSIEKRLLDEFKIRKDSIKIIPKSHFDNINTFKKAYDIFEELTCEVVKNRIHNKEFDKKTMLVNANKLLEVIGNIKTQLLEPSESQEIERLLNSPNLVCSATPSVLDETACTFNSTRNEIEIDNLGDIIASLSDNMDHVPIVTNSQNDGSDATMEEIILEPLCQDSVENVAQSQNLGEMDQVPIITNIQSNGSDATMEEIILGPLSQDNVENVAQSQNLREITDLSDKMDQMPIITNIQSNGSDPDATMEEIILGPLSPDNVENVAKSQNLGEISDNIDQMPINKNFQNECVPATVEIKSEPLDQDNIENVTQSQNLGEISALSDNMSQMPIITNIQNDECVARMVEIKSEPLIENDIESVVQSQYLEEIPDSSFDNKDFLSIISNIQNDGCVGAMVEIKPEPLDQDDVETIVRSPYFLDDHSYCKSDVADSTVEYFTANDFDLENSATNMNMEHNSQNSIPQIMFSQRCINKIINENINVDHLLVKYASKNNRIPSSPQIYHGYENTPDST